MKNFLNLGALILYWIVPCTKSSYYAKMLDFLINLSRQFLNGLGAFDSIVNKLKFLPSILCARRAF